jgi:amino acid permease
MMNDETKLESQNLIGEQTAQTINHSSEDGSKKLAIISIIAVVVIIVLVGVSAYFLLTARPEVTEQIRDVFIIFMALESLIIGVALVVLIVQLSTLINLLQNEIRPILNSTSETVNTLKGTAKFVSNHMAEPVIKINQALAVLKSMFLRKK